MDVQNNLWYSYGLHVLRQNTLGLYRYLKERSRNTSVTRTLRTKKGEGTVLLRLKLLIQVGSTLMLDFFLPWMFCRVAKLSVVICVYNGACIALALLRSAFIASALFMACKLLPVQISSIYSKNPCVFSQKLEFIQGLPLPWSVRRCHASSAWTE